MRKCLQRILASRLFVRVQEIRSVLRRSPLLPLPVWRFQAALCTIWLHILCKFRHMPGHARLSLPDFAVQSLGDGVNQKGSVVDEERLRFDFSHPKPVPANKMAEIEGECRRQLRAALPVYAKDVRRDDALHINGAPSPGCGSSTPCLWQCTNDFF